MKSTTWTNRWRTCLAGVALLVASGPLLVAEPIIAAAADLKFALEEVAKSFQKDSGQSVKLILLFFS